ncbi:hypothetical protein EAF04_001840 [Stromatinia cepivora]|nr:hypothetical protein EAF04_001840 [Stromatinia cepivora]
MSNPFARPKEYLPSMNRQGITVWAHDVINELVRLGALDPGNEDASNDLFGVYKNLEQFYKWVCSRPRIGPHHAPRPLQSITRPFGIFALAHELWDDLEWELRPEKEGAFIEQMIDHLGWFWNIKANLSNKIRRNQGLSVISKMDTLAEVASYALRSSNISRGNIIKCPMARPVSSVNHLMSPAAPASRNNPRNVGAWSPESRTRQEKPSENTMRSDQASSFAIPTQKTDTGHLQLPQYSQFVQGQPQASMRRSPSSYNTQPPKPRSIIQCQPPNFPNETPRNLVDLVDDDDYSSVKYTSISRVPMGSILPTPQIRGDKHSKRAQGFAGGSMHPVMNMSGVKPAVDSGSDHALRNASRTSSRDLKYCHGGRESNQPRNSPYDSGFEESVEGSNTNMIIIVDSPSPELENMAMKIPDSQGHKNHPTSAVVSSEDSGALERPSSRNILPTQTKTKSLSGLSSFQANLWAPVNSLNNNREVKASESAKVKGQPSDRRADEQESRNTGGTKWKRPNSTSINKGIITDNNMEMEGTKAKNSTSTNGTRRDIKGNNINNTGEATMKKPVSIPSTHNNITENSMGEIKGRRPTSDGNQEDSSDNPNKKVKTSTNSTAQSSEYFSPYMSLLNQEQPSTPAKSTTLATVDGPVSENSPPTSPTVRNARGLYRPFSMRNPVKKDGSEGN